MGFGSLDGLDGSSTEVASVDCLRGMYAVVVVAGLISGEVAFLLPPLELEGSSRHGFPSSIDSSDDSFHGGGLMASSERPLGETERSEVTPEDIFPVDDMFPPNAMPSGESLSPDPCMLPDVTISEAVFDSDLRVLEGSILHIFLVVSYDLPESFFDSSCD